MIYSIGDDIPQIDDTAFVAPSADIMGKVILKEQSSVWFNASFVYSIQVLRTYVSLVVFRPVYSSAPQDGDTKLS